MPAPYNSGGFTGEWFQARTHNSSCGSVSGSGMALGMCTCTKEHRVSLFHTACRVYDTSKIQKEVQDVWNEIQCMKSSSTGKFY